VLAGGALIRGAPVAADAEPGLGQASGQLLRIEPTSAGLSFGVVVGPVSSDHRNEVARAVAQSMNYGLIGAALTAEGCTGGAPVIDPATLPVALRADSRDAGAGTSKTVSEGPITQTVVADGTPDARSSARLVDVGVPGLLSLAGMSEWTRSTIDDEGVRVATAHVEVADVQLLAGLVELHGLTWDGRHDGTNGASGAFRVQGASIAGVPVPTSDPVELLDGVNAVTSALGITISAPAVREVGDNVFVDPLTVAIVPNAGRDVVSAALLEGVQPLREALFGALIDADCSNSAYITVLDILLGSVTGSGSFRLSLGGVDAGSSVVDSYVFDAAPPRAAAGMPVASTKLPAFDGPPAVGTVAGPTDVARPASVASSTDDVPDGAVAVALVALGLGAVLVELDRRTMRRTAGEEEMAA
jgi:hypothetical protein